MYRQIVLLCFSLVVLSGLEAKQSLSAGLDQRVLQLAVPTDVTAGQAASAVGTTSGKSAAADTDAADQSQSLPDDGTPASASPPKFTSKSGMFTILEGEGRTLFEIPNELFGRELFWYAEVTSDPPETDGILGNSVGSALVRFELRDGVVDVRDLTERSRARVGFSQDVMKPHSAPSSIEKFRPLDRAVEASDMPPVMMSMPVLGKGPNGGVVIDVTDVFLSDLDAFSVGKALLDGTLENPLLVGGVDPHRSYIEQALAFPRNVYISSLLTFAPPSGVAELGNHEVRPATKPLSVAIGHTIALLPEVPMKARLFDERVGYFTSAYTDYDMSDRALPEDQSIILRRRLEKKDPSQDVSEPVEPIVFYIGRDVPDRWRPYLKQAVEDWQPAFEAAGFKNAIIAKDAPTSEEDPDWHPADARWSVIRWVTEPIENAMGPNIHDPRSGEILSAHVLVWAEVLDIAEQWYFTQAGGVDKKAATLPLPEEVLGRYLRAIVSHEVGHTLGLRHNFKASQAYSVDQLRDPEFANTHGPVASIMSYGRINFVAQPGDGVTEFLPKVGPYDRFAIAWGYKPIPEADTPFDEIPTLDKWADAQLDNPWLAFGGEDFAALFDPTVLTETIGKERIEATALGLKNIDRVAERLAESAREQDGTNQAIAEMYGVLLDTRTSWITDVAKIVGGVIEHRAEAIAKGAPRYETVSADDQRRAVAYVLAEGLKPPEKFLDPKLLSLFAIAGATRPVEKSQATILHSLLTGRVYCILNQQAVLDPDAYAIVDLLEDVTVAVWAELKVPGTPINPLRRSLQRDYLDRLASQLAKQEQPIDIEALAIRGVPPEAAEILLSSGQATDFDSAITVVLTKLADRIEASIEWSEDPATVAHLSSSLAKVKAILEHSS